jgi:purine-binding chemotaxis protein CheW
MDLSPCDIEAPPPFGTPVRGDYLKGLGKIGKKFVLILDIDRVLSAEDLPEAAEGPSPEAGRSQGLGTTPSF